jgi:RNA polymerase sigma factor (sigma-70 family)
MQDVAGSNSQIEPTDERLMRDYVANRDAAAFAAIVRRHGRVVSAVCRRILQREQDVEDAFQATFLVLVRKAPSLNRPNLLGNWLYGVAYRIASKIRSANARQRAREAAMVDPPALDTNDDASWRDLRPVLDDELRRLPERYRRPIVLFYLEGKSAEEVAITLGRPRGTILSQLARARERLRARLSRRKLALSLGVLAVLLERTASADVTVPDHLLDIGLQATGSAGVSTQARLLARDVLKEMFRRRLGTIGSLLLAAILAAGAGFLIYGAFHAPPAIMADGISDLDALQGSWQVVAVQQGGRALPNDRFPFTTLNISRDTIIHKGGLHELEVRFRLHPEQQPRAIDMESEGYHRDTYKAIYTLKGDTLTICRPYEGQRPAEFISEPGSNILLFTARRIPPAGP